MAQACLSLKLPTRIFTLVELIENLLMFRHVRGLTLFTKINTLYVKKVIPLSVHHKRAQYLFICLTSLK